MLFLSESKEETQEIASDIIGKTIFEDNFKFPLIFLLNGNLGSGKTVFVSGALKYFGVKNIKSVSPTFVIFKKYNVNGNNIKSIYHIDAYRIKSKREFSTIGFEDIIKDKNGIVFIEWPENIQGFKFSGFFKINFEYGDSENERIITAEYIK